MSFFFVFVSCCFWHHCQRKSSRFGRIDVSMLAQRLSLTRLIRGQAQRRRQALGCEIRKRGSRASRPQSLRRAFLGRTTARGMSRLNASAPGGKKKGSFFPHTAKSGGLCARKYSWK